MQVAIESLQSEQQLIKVGLANGVSTGGMNSVSLGEIIHTLGEQGKAIDGLNRQLQVIGYGIDHVGSGVGLLLDRTNTMPIDIRLIKSRLGLQ